MNTYILHIHKPVVVGSSLFYFFAFLFESASKIYVIQISKRCAVRSIDDETLAMAFNFNVYIVHTNLFVIYLLKYLCIVYISRTSFTFVNLNSVNRQQRAAISNVALKSIIPSCPCKKKHTHT